MEGWNGRIIGLAAAGLALSLGLAGESVQAATIQADSNVNVRVAPDLNSPKVGYILKGQTMDIMGTANGWYQILWNGQAAWTSMNRWTGFTATTAGRVNYRLKADVEAPRIGSIEEGREVLVLGRSDDWLYIEYQGIRGFSWSGNWNVTAAFVEDLPYVQGDLPLGGMTAGEPPSQEEAPLKSAGDAYRVLSAIPGYELSADARAGEEPVRTVPAGIYLIQKVAGGVYKLILDETSVVWIDPGANTGRSFPEVPKIPLPLEGAADAPDGPVIPAEPEIRQWQPGDEFQAAEALAGHLTAEEAAAGGPGSVTLDPGRYVVYLSHEGMLNLSASMEEPGAWVDPGIDRAEPAPAETIGRKVVREAEKLLGAPYIFGAESWEEGGFDCSGLTQYSYGQLGIDIPRTASWQWAGIEQKVTEPKPGDIITFARNGEVFHVGIYIGDRRMIHAPKPGDVVKIGSLDWWYDNGLVLGYLRPSSQEP